MKRIIIISLLFVSCKQKPEFYIDGVPYYTSTVCVKSHDETIFGYHYGLNPTSGKMEFYNGFYIKDVCDEEKIDTIEIKY